jgi:hypothetical protein
MAARVTNPVTAQTTNFAIFIISFRSAGFLLGKAN